MKTVIFDMDGVIFDSERATYYEWKALSEKYKFDNLDEIYYKCIGVNASTCKQNFLDFYGKDFPFDEYSKEKSESYHKKYDGGNLPLKTGVVKLLEYLKNQGYFTAVASSTRTPVVTSQMECAGLSKYFDRIIGGDMVTRSKPNPDIFLEAIKNIDVDKDEVYVIEDSYNGIRAAKAAEMKPIMVPDMLPANEEMKSLAFGIFDSLNEVKDFFEKAE